MVGGRGYRVVSAAGAVALTAIGIMLANTAAVQNFLTSTVPLVWRLQPEVLEGERFVLAMVTGVVAVVAALGPLYKPQPRRILGVVYHVQRRVIVAGLALATVGYFDYTYQLPRTTLVVLVGFLLITLPPWFVSIRRRPDGDGERLLVVGNDPEEIRRVYDALDVHPVGYVGPPLARVDGGVTIGREVPESIDGRSRLGGLSRLAEVITRYEVDTAALAFETTDRGEFFGALGTCHDHGVDAVIHRDRADSVLVSGDPGQELLDVDIEPWDWQERMVKRLFDIGFSGAALVCLTPLVIVIALAVKLEDGGSILYRQERTAGLGTTFPVYKFRSMVEDAEAETGVKLSEEDSGGRDSRVTRVGSVLRRTHLDEIPQLWSILVGDMSVVGPRPERPELDTDIGEGGIRWEQRWFVKPGLTGLAQINGVTGHEPEKKLRYDVEYIRRQSLRADIAIVIRQIWRVVGDAIGFFEEGDSVEVEDREGR